MSKPSPSARQPPSDQGQASLPGRSANTLALALLVSLLAACTTPLPKPAPPAPADQPPPRSTRPVLAPPAPTYERDGPEAMPPPNLDLVPDAEPRIEPVRPGGPNKPYEVAGTAYTPLLGDPALVQRGLASWYGRKFHGRSTASGESYNMYAMTAAHRTMPLPSYAKVRNPANGREVVVRVNDRGPFHSDRIIDLSYTAALKLGLLGGVATVEVERITYEAIRTGAWRPPSSGGGNAPRLAEPAAPEGGDPIGDLAQRRLSRDATADEARAALPPRAVADPADGPTPQRAAALTAAATATQPAVAAAKSARGFWLQLGAFRERDGAVGEQQHIAQRADWLAPLLTIFNDQRLHRLQAGPYGSRADALAAAERLRQALPLQPLVVERR